MLQYFYMDEDALNVLLAEGIDVPTAVAASLEDQELPAELYEPAPWVSWASAALAAVAGALMYWLFG